LKKYRSCLYSLLVVAAAFVVRMGLDPWLGDRSPFLIFTLAIVISAGLFGIVPGILATLSSLILGMLFFLGDWPNEPLSMDQIFNVGFFLATSSGILVVANHLRMARRRSEELELQLEHTRSVTSMGTMAATLAHELNQPLAASANYLAACKQIATRIDSDKKQSFVKGLGEAEAQIQRAGAIIRHARALVANAPAPRKPASLRRMLARVTEVVETNGVKCDTELAIDIQPGADFLLVEPVQIEQVLLNIVRNACEVLAGKESAPEIAVSARVADDKTMIEIRDNGPGIPPERLKTLFSASQGSTTGGLGIGLSISRTIVEAHSGNLWAQNNPDGGASFFMTLPRAVREGRAEAA
jgi:C4-dicarboxylate-specific signal transduction histidine kinase